MYRNLLCVYDDFGRLCYILPPSIVPTTVMMPTTLCWPSMPIYIATTTATVWTLQNSGSGSGTLCLLACRAPLVAETDATLAEGVWRLHLYDKFGREVVTGTATLADSDIASLSEKAWPVGPPTGDYITETPTDPPLLYDLSGVPKGSDFAPEKYRCTTYAPIMRNRSVRVAAARLSLFNKGKNV